jgi:hypothetical protein
MAYGKISKIDCGAAFYDDCHCRRRRDMGDSRGGPHLRAVTPRALGYSPTGQPRFAASHRTGVGLGVRAKQDNPEI